MPRPKSKSTPRRRRILLAIELSCETAERRLGIADYARKVGWILESRLVAFAALKQEKDYLAVIGSDNDPILAELGAVPLLSVDIARQRSGYEAAVLLDALIDGTSPTPSTPPSAPPPTTPPDTH